MRVRPLDSLEGASLLAVWRPCKRVCPEQDGRCFRPVTEHSKASANRPAPVGWVNGPSPSEIGDSEDSQQLFVARGTGSMCDYSLHHVASRSAKRGDMQACSPRTPRTGS